MKTTKTRKTAPKLIANASLIKNGLIYCVNHNENSTPFWGGTRCSNTQKHDGSLVRWTCSECVAKSMPAPIVRPITAPVVDPVTGETIKRKRGRPRKNPIKPVALDENGNPVKRGRGRPKGSKNKTTLVKEQLIKDGVIKQEPKRGRGRPKGSTNKKSSK